jgi:hypothetical protein
MSLLFHSALKVYSYKCLFIFTLFIIHLRIIVFYFVLLIFHILLSSLLYYFKCSEEVFIEFSATEMQNQKYLSVRS